jgi:hypothetical protein
MKNERNELQAIHLIHFDKIKRMKLLFKTLIF